MGEGGHPGAQELLCAALQPRRGPVPPNPVHSTQDPAQALAMKVTHSGPFSGSQQSPSLVDPLSSGRESSCSLLPKHLTVLSPLRSKEQEKRGPSAHDLSAHLVLPNVLSACIGLMTDSSTPAWRYTQGN